MSEILHQFRAHRKRIDINKSIGRSVIMLLLLLEKLHPDFMKVIPPLSIRGIDLYVERYTSNPDTK